MLTELVLAVLSLNSALVGGSSVGSGTRISPLSTPSDEIVWEPAQAYRIVQSLGSGRYSHVFEGVRLRDEKIVAVKVEFLDH